MRFAALGLFLLGVCALSGCGTRALTPEEQTQQFTIETKLTRAEALHASEEWLASTAASMKTVVGASQPEAGSVVGKAHMSGRMVTVATATTPAVYEAETDFAIAITSQDNQTDVIITLEPHAVDDEAVSYYASENRKLVYGLAAALKGTVTKVPTAAAAPVKPAVGTSSY